MNNQSKNKQADWKLENTREQIAIDVTFEFV